MHKFYKMFANVSKMFANNSQNVRKMFATESSQYPYQTNNIDIALILFFHREPLDTPYKISRIRKISKISKCAFPKCKFISPQLSIFKNVHKLFSIFYTFHTFYTKYTLHIFTIISYLHTEHYHDYFPLS